MNDEITNLLKEYGLDDKEIKIYLYLVGSKGLNAYILAKKTGIHRSTTYDVLERLISKGFINKIQEQEKTIYSAIEIGQTISKIKNKESILLSLIPKLEKLREEGVSKVRILESKESQKQFNFNLFNQVKKGTIKELYIISGGPSNENTEQKPSENLGSEIFLESLLKEIKRKKLHKKFKYKAIWNNQFKDTKILELFSKIGENRFLKELPTLATTVIFGEYLAYLFTMDGNPQVIEIQNRLIAEENKAYFSYLWKIAKF